MKKSTRDKIESSLDSLVKRYIQKASDKPKSNSGNPFVMALLKDFEPLLHRIHGMKTSLGNEMEKIAETIAIETWGNKNVVRNLNHNVRLPQNVFQTIDSIINNLSNAKKLSNYKNEKELIIQACLNPTDSFEEHTYEFDLELFSKDENKYYYLEMKGPDPNTTEVPGAKKRLLIAMAWAYFNNKAKDVDSLFSIYYNNKHPKPYKNHKVLYYFDPDGGLLVQEKFWNFIGKDNNCYNELLSIFSNYGIKNKKKIWDGFSNLINLNNVP